MAQVLDLTLWGWREKRQSGVSDIERHLLVRGAVLIFIMCLLKTPIL